MILPMNETKLVGTTQYGSVTMSVFMCKHRYLYTCVTFCTAQLKNDLNIRKQKYYQIFTNEARIHVADNG